MKKTNNKKTKAHTMRANRFVRTIIEEKKRGELDNSGAVYERIEGRN